jgi:hypothetical protein
LFFWVQLFFSYFKDLLGQEVMVELKNDLAISSTKKKKKTHPTPPNLPPLPRGALHGFTLYHAVHGLEILNPQGWVAGEKMAKIRLTSPCPVLTPNHISIMR